MAAFNPGSGMDTSCASAVATHVVAAKMLSSNTRARGIFFFMHSLIRKSRGTHSVKAPKALNSFVRILIMTRRAFSGFAGICPVVDKHGQVGRAEHCESEPGSVSERE